jgi:hypothetical protein
LAEAGAEIGFADRVAPAYTQATGHVPDIFVCRTSAGAGVALTTEC